MTYFLEARLEQAIPSLELGLDFGAARSDLWLLLNLLSNNAKAYETFYLEGADHFRRPLATLASQIPNTKAPRLLDRTCVATGALLHEPGMSFVTDPVIDRLVFSLPFPLAPEAHPPARGRQTLTPASAR